MPNAWFDQDFYIAQKVAQMNATGYTGRTGTAGQVWTAETAAAELAAFGITWEDNFTACNQGGYASNITVADINVSPNALFNVSEYAQAIADYNNANSVGGQTNWTASSVISDLLNNQHMSLWQHYTTTGARLGLNPSNAFDTNAWLAQQAAATGMTADEILNNLASQGSNPVAAYFDGGGTVENAPAVADPVEVPAGFSPWATGSDNPDPDNPDVPEQPVYTNTIYLTPELDVVQGTDGNDHIIGQEFDGVNTLQSGDRIDGGAGQDLLTADVTAGNTYGQILNTVRPEVHNVEKIKFTSQQSTDYASTGGQGAQAIAGIRADRIDGMEELWSSDSRATLTVDDVRVDSNTMLIGWQNADNAEMAGNNMDYIVRYNNQYLKADDASTQSTLRLQVMDMAGALNDGEPLLNNIYDRVAFMYNGSLVTLDMSGMEGVSGASATYQTLLAAIQQAIANNPAAEGLTAELGPDFTYWDKNHTASYSGESIIITAANGTLSSSEPGCGWIPNIPVPPDSDLDTDMIQAQSTDCPLLRTDIALDNVGMVEWNNVNTCIPNNQQFGDYAGDMIVGGQGDGNYVGLQRFDVTVDRGSWLKSLQSTNHSLRMITVKNADLDDADTKGGTSNADLGNLFIGEGQRLTNSAIAGGSLMFEGRDGMLADAKLSPMFQPRDTASLVNPTGQTVESGIVDVMHFDASAMTGKANISAAVTSWSSEKYFGATDQVDGLGNKFAPSGNFSYSFGSNDDTLNMSINGNVAADNDFHMSINMGDGNNSVHTSFDTYQNQYDTTDPANPIQQRNWIHNQWQQNNVNVTTGSGNDIVNPWGDGRVQVSVGAGNDIVYSDNSGIESQIAGVGAVWVVNGADTNADGKNTNVVGVNNGKIVPLNNDIASNPNSRYDIPVASMSEGDFVTLKVKVAFKGIGAEHTIRLNVTPNTEGDGGTASISAHQLNQLIMDAINDESASWLHAVLSAEEGAGNTLMLISKVDGVPAAPTISFEATQGGQSEPVPVQPWFNATNGYGVADAAIMQKVDENGTVVDGEGDLVTGENSTAWAANTINLGAGRDLAVLGTSINGHDTIVLNNGDNGHDTIMNFSFVDGAQGQDFFDVTNVLGAQASTVLNRATYTNADEGLEDGTVRADGSVQIATNISFVTNADKDSEDYINSAQKLLDSINADDDTPTNNNTLFMVHDVSGSATFQMYLGSFDNNGNATVTGLGNITFADFVIDAQGNTGSTLADFFSASYATFGKATFDAALMDDIWGLTPPATDDGSAGGDTEGGETGGDTEGGETGGDTEGGNTPVEDALYFGA